MQHQALCALLPVVVLLAVDAAVLAEAGKLRLQVEFALAALEATHVPLFVHGQQVVPVRDLPAAARAQSHPLAGHTRHGLQGQHGDRDMRTRRQDREKERKNEKHVKSECAWHREHIMREGDESLESSLEQKWNDERSSLLRATDTDTRLQRNSADKLSVIKTVTYFVWTSPLKIFLNIVK